MTTFTTQYSPLEDRMVVVTEFAAGGKGRLFLTQRLLKLLLPKLDAALLEHYQREASRPPETLVSEAQATPRAKGSGAAAHAKPPVAVDANTETALVAAASLKVLSQGLALTFTTEAEREPQLSFQVVLSFDNLHAWLQIVRQLTAKAGWVLADEQATAKPAESQRAGWH